MDERFKQVLTDPRFKTLKKSERKVRIDGRFQKMFTDKKFGTKSDVDPRFGKVEQEEECVSDKTLESFYDTSHCSVPADPSILRANAQHQEADVSSSSDESSDEDDEVQLDHNWGELDKDVSRSNDISRRLAVCNVDWDRIKAPDLFVLLNSFKPAAGSITSVNVYASEFGKKRMAEEAIRGPAEIATTPVIDDCVTEHEAGDAAEDEYMQEQLRQYQLNRLKYFYAIVECDSQVTANSLYEQLDNQEFESSASSLDLRFVPDTEIFEEEDAVQSCTSLPDTATYKAPIFITSALQQSSVSLTWDETDPSRAQKIESAFASRDEKQLDDLQTFLASDESDSSDQEPDEQVPAPDTDSPMPTKLNKYKQLLQAVEDENKSEEADMEITFDNGDDSDQEKGSGAETHDVGTTSENESEVSKELDESSGGRKTGEAGANVELELLVDEGKSHFNFSDFVDDGKRRKKRKGSAAPAVDDFEFDDRDPRFTRIFSSPDYNIDPSNPHFKKTPGMISMLQRKANIAMSVGPRRKK